MKSITACWLSLFIITNITAQTDKAYQSYLAHISAANSSLRLNEKKEAKRWLQNAPQQYRGWEWNYQKGRIDGSFAVFEFKDDAPTKISYSNDGKYVACGDSKGIIYILNAQTFEEVKQITGHLNSVYSVKFSLDDTKIISCSRDTTIRILGF